MRCHLRLAFVLLAGLLVLPSLRAEERVVRKKLQELQPARAAVSSGDPAEPPVQVVMSTPDQYALRTGRVTRATPIQVSSGPKGTVLTLPTTGSHGGSTQLAFANSAPPMRFTLKLTRVPKADLSSLSLTSGTLTLQVGAVSTLARTRHYNARGDVQTSSVGAAYTIHARRTEAGEVEMEVRRGPGAALGKSLVVSWQANYAYDNFKRGALRLIDSP